jgi:hypothetical protein
MAKAKKFVLNVNQREIVKEVLDEWAQNEAEVLSDAFNYDMTKREVKAREKRLDAIYDIIDII